VQSGPFVFRRSGQGSQSPHQTRVENVEKAKKGLILTVHNKADVQSIFKNCYEAKFVRGQQITTCHMFRNIIGHFEIFSIVCGNLTAEDVCSPGSLFEYVVYLKTIKVFISYFQLRCASSTVLCKAFHLKVIARAGSHLFYRCARHHRASMAHTSREYLRSVCSA
jgi:hypothetical protein